MPDAWLSPLTVARELGVRDSKVFAWIRSGELTAVDLTARRGGRPRYKVSRESLAAFIAGRTVTPEAKPIRRRKLPPTARQYF